MTNGMKTISILPISANMGSAMERLAEIEGRDLSYSLAIGCSYNDSSFFGRTGLVGCPANADERCIEIVKKKKGNKVSLHNYSLAVVDLIRWLTGENAQ
jgi:hydroxymethylpyrimidine pyrophosphatase-like HAD family hydrolase